MIKAKLFIVRIECWTIHDTGYWSVGLFRSSRSVRELFDFCDFYIHLAFMPFHYFRFYELEFQNSNMSSLRWFLLWLRRQYWHVYGAKAMQCTEDRQSNWIQCYYCIIETNWHKLVHLTNCRVVVWCVVDCRRRWTLSTSIVAHR